MTLDFCTMKEASCNASDYWRLVWAEIADFTRTSSIRFPPDT